MQSPQPGSPLMDRVRLIGYGAIGGIVVGAFLGWMFHDIVGLIVKLMIVIILLIPLVFAILFWRRVTTTPASTTRADVRDADWVEIGTGGRRQQ
jgi:F0F1-type ATP synthase assembly protein I